MLLAIDTATDWASIALHDGHCVRVEYTWESQRRHTVELLPRLVEALAQVDGGVERLSAVAVTRGPGSFSGLRVGMAAAKGLALARRLPLLGAPTLDVVAAGVGRDRRPLCAVVQAGRGRICAATYRWRGGAWRAQEPPCLTTWATLAGEISTPTLICGEVDAAGLKSLAACGDMAALLPPPARLRRAGFLAELAWQRLRRGEVDDPAALTLLYLQHPAL